MKITEQNLRAFDFLDEGEELYKRFWATETKYLSDKVGIRKIISEDGRVRIEIVLDSQVNKKDIPAVWSQINTEIAKVAQRQGHDLSDYLQVVLMGLVDGDYYWMREVEGVPVDTPFRYRLEKGVPNYRDLFMDTNFDLLLFIIRISKIDKDESRAKLADHYFSNLLRNFRYKEDVIIELKDASIEEIGDRRCPFDIYYGPIDFDKFKNRLEYLVERYGKDKRSSTSKLNMLDVYRWFVVWGDWEDADKLLMNTFPSTYKEYKPRLSARLGEILKHATE